MDKTAKQRASDRIEKARGRLNIKSIKPLPKPAPSGESVILERIAGILGQLVSKKTDVTVNVPEQKAADPQIAVNFPDQVKPSIHVNVPEQKPQPAPIINVKVPAQQPPKPPNITLPAPIITVEAPISQGATWEELRFKIVRLNNGLMDEVVLTRVR